MSRAGESRSGGGELHLDLARTQYPQGYQLGGEQARDSYSQSIQWKMLNLHLGHSPVFLMLKWQPTYAIHE